MPQYWWEAFPEVRGPAMKSPAWQSEMSGAPQAPINDFDLMYFSGDGADQDPYFGHADGPAMAPNAAIGQAGAAAQAEAAARARLAQMGGDAAGPDAPQPLLNYGFAGSARSGSFDPAFGTTGPDILPVPQDMRVDDQARQDQGGLKTNLFPDAYAPDQPVNLQHRASAVELAPLKRGYPYQAKGGLPPASHSSGHRPLVFVSSASGKPPRPPADVNGYGYVPAADDLNLLARALYAEFSTVSNWRDMPAGAWSMLNRIRPNGRWPSYRTIDTIGSSLLDVLNKRTRDGRPQYSFVPPGGIGAAGGSDRWQESAHPQTMTGSARQAWMWAVDTARRVLGGVAVDRTGGATHFYNRIHGTPATVEGYFRDATRGPNPTLTYAPYRSPTGENFFLRTIEDPPRPVPWRPTRRHYMVPLSHNH